MSDSKVVNNRYRDTDAEHFVKKGMAAGSDFKPINSSNLEAASYDFEMEVLRVKFKTGTTYRYHDVTPELYRNFEKTFDGKDGNSAGRFFQTNIRHLPSEKIGE